MRRAKAKHLKIQLVPQAPQHPLADDPLVQVEDILNDVVGDDKRQEYHAEKDEIGYLLELIAHKGLRKLLALDRIVDDPFRHFERHVDEWERKDGNQQDEQLLPPAEMPDEPEKRLLHTRRPFPPPASGRPGAQAGPGWTTANPDRPAHPLRRDLDTARLHDATPSEK